jgi:hypothetical protein
MGAYSLKSEYAAVSRYVVLDVGGGGNDTWLDR